MKTRATRKAPRKSHWRHLPHKSLACWATAICLVDTSGKHAQELLLAFNERSLRADLSIFNRLLENGGTKAIAAHPLLYTLKTQQFESLVRRLCGQADYPETVANILFAIAMHRLRYPFAATPKLDALVRKLAAHPDITVRSRGIEGRLVLGQLLPSDRAAIVSALEDGAPGVLRAAAVRALWYCLQKPRYKGRFKSVVDRKALRNRLRTVLSQKNRYMHRPFKEDVRSALREAIKEQLPFSD